VPKPPYHGLYIELKYGNNKLSPAQQAIMAELEGYGYAVAVCYGANDAIDVIQRYITK